MAKSNGNTRSYRGRSASNSGRSNGRSTKTPGGGQTKLGDSVTLPAGFRAGLTTLREPTRGTVVRLDRNDRGDVIAGIRFQYKNRRGRVDDRTTWITLR